MLPSLLSFPPPSRLSWNSSIVVSYLPPALQSFLIALIPSIFSSSSSLCQSRWLGEKNKSFLLSVGQSQRFGHHPPLAPRAPSHHHLSPLMYVFFTFTSSCLHQTPALLSSVSFTYFLTTFLTPCINAVSVHFGFFFQNNPHLFFHMRFLLIFPSCFCVIGWFSHPLRVSVWTNWITVQLDSLRWIIMSDLFRCKNHTEISVIKTFLSLHSSVICYCDVWAPTCTASHPRTRLRRLLIIYTIDSLFFLIFLFAHSPEDDRCWKRWTIRDKSPIFECAAATFTEGSLGVGTFCRCWGSRLFVSMCVCECVSSVSSCASPVERWQQIFWFNCHCLENTIICFHFALSIILS